VLFFELDVQLGSFGKGGEVAGAEALTDFLEDGAVLDECDDDLELDAVLVFNVCRSIAATRDTVLSATDDAWGWR